MTIDHRKTGLVQEVLMVIPKYTNLLIIRGFSSGFSEAVVKKV